MNPYSNNISRCINITFTNVLDTPIEREVAVSRVRDASVLIAQLLFQPMKYVYHTAINVSVPRRDDHSSFYRLLQEHFPAKAFYHCRINNGKNTFVCRMRRSKRNSNLPSISAGFQFFR